jgi:arylsulfatase
MLHRFDCSRSLRTWLKKTVAIALIAAFLFAGNLPLGMAAMAATYSSYGEAKAATANTSGKPNIVVIWGDDIGQSDISAYTKGLMGFQTPNIDRVANEGMIFTDYYADQSSR